jgi:hypothetical protein
MTTNRPPSCPRSDAFALVEAVIASLLVGLLFVTAMNVVAASRTSQALTLDRVIGQELAVDLLNEILHHAYSEPFDVPRFGRESGEPADLRAGYNDVDDYHGWSASPPQHANGTPMTEYEGWRRSVQIAWVDPAAPDTVITDDRGAKRIVVIVERQGRIVARAAGIRTAAWRNPVPAPERVSDNRPPVAVAQGAPLVVSRNSLVSFSAAASSDPDSDALTYYWNFGDGGGGVGGVTAGKRYSQSGFYTVTLTVSDGQAIDTDQLVVEVQ